MSLLQVKPFDPLTTTHRWVFIGVDIYPEEDTEGLAGWRAQVLKSKKASGGKHAYSIKIGEFEPSWFSQDFVQILTFLSD